MELIKEVLTYLVKTETDACSLIEQFRQKQDEEGYSIGKNGYIRKVKTDKKSGEIIDESYFVTVEKKYDV